MATKYVFPITVDYNRSLAEMIKTGNYDRVDSNIEAKNFPLKGKDKHELEAVLFHFDRNIGSNEAIAEMDKQGFRPARIEELLALCEKYLELQKEFPFPIVALGSVWQDSHCNSRVAYLFWVSSKRGLDLRSILIRWDSYYRFLAFRK